MTSEPTLFDLAEFEREAIAATPWDGAPLGYTTDYYEPAALVAAFERYCAEHGHFGCIPRSHMWHSAHYGGGPTVAEGHELHMFTADAWCREADHDHSAAPLPGGGRYQANCPRCAWHIITDNESAAVEAWHDHALPGWRELPILPRKLARFENKQRIAAVAAWISATYPAAWQRPGVPILTERGEHGRRHVPGRSPLGGYDLAAD